MQQSLNGGCCLHRLGLFTESFAICHHLRKVQLIYSYFGIINYITHYCLFLLFFLYYVFRLGFVVGALNFLWLSCILLSYFIKKEKKKKKKKKEEKNERKRASLGKAILLDGSCFKVV